MRSRLVSPGWEGELAAAKGNPADDAVEGATEAEDKRVALIIANGDYKGAPLENPTIDADLYQVPKSPTHGPTAAFRST